MPHPLLLTTLLLIASSVFMTFAWYGHLKKNFTQSPWHLAALTSWGNVLFKYLLQAPTASASARSTCRN